MGVWIEILRHYLEQQIIAVTPCVGVWIEISIQSCICSPNHVTPCVGVWIEMGVCDVRGDIANVTPCVGVWIEICVVLFVCTFILSLPAWECGLKFSSSKNLYRYFRHSLRGSVD